MQNKMRTIGQPVEMLEFKKYYFFVCVPEKT